MKKKKVIRVENLPTRLPLLPTLLIAIALDYFNAPQWLWGVVGFGAFLVWTICIIEMVYQEKIDIFDKNKDN